jgi:hypothetical protein
MKKLIFPILILICFLSETQGQELSCNFSINSSKIQGTNKQIFTTLENTIRDFLNNTVWTNNVFESSERIECNITLDINENPSGNDFKGKLQIQSRRPVFNSSYSSTLFNYVDDDVDFHYEEYDAVEFSENTFISNLSSIMSFYAYIIIGLDYDSFSPKGGTPFYEKAEKIMNVAQTSSYSGWKASDGEKGQRHKNRYWLVDNLLDADYSPIRDFYYKYHRLGLDQMEGSPDISKTTIMESLEILRDFNKEKPDPFVALLQVVIDGKSEEIVNVFSTAQPDVKKKVLDILVAMDPAGGNKYNPLKS